MVSEDARFDALCRELLGIEGGHTNDPVDRGGETNYGISLRFLVIEGQIDLDGDGLADFDLDGDGDIDGADIRLLTPDDAKALYRRCFWDRFKCGAIPQTLDGAVFDQAVNGGGVAAAKLLQQTINAVAGKRAGFPIAVDGAIGPKTLGALRKSLTLAPMPRHLYFYRQAAIARYEGIVARLPEQRKYLKGWKARALRLGNV